MIRRVFYGWWIVTAGFVIEALIGSLMFHAYGAYLALLRDESPPRSERPGEPGTLLDSPPGS